MRVLFCAIWALVSTLLFPNFISDDTLGFSNSVFSLFFFCVLYVILWESSKQPKDIRLKVYTHILGFLFAFMISAGHSLDQYGSVFFKDSIGSIILFTHIIAELLSLIWRFLVDFESKLIQYKPQSRVAIIFEEAMTWLLEHPIMIAIVLLLCWLPCFIADYPGGFRYDATAELHQINNGFNANYPLLHSVIITRLLPAIYNLTGSYNTGIAVYVIIQMILISCMYTHIICTFGKRNINRVLLLVLLLYCGCFPVIQILVVQEVRDVLFSALLVYAVFLFYLMVSDKENFLGSIGKPILLGVVVVLALLARNNNAGKLIYIAIMAICVIVWIVNRKKYLRGATIFSVTSIVSYLLLGTIFTAMCQPLAPANLGESLSIMSQPIARAYLYENEKWTEEEVAELRAYMNLDGIEYYTETADSTKSRINIQNNFRGFLKFWCKIGTEHLGCYIDAILANTQNMWYPDSVIDGYKQVFKEEGQPYYDVDKCYYSIQGKLAAPAVHLNLWPEVLHYYTQIGMFISFEKIPIVSMLFSIGFQFWVILHCFFYIMYRRLRKLILPLAIILGYMLVSACVPLVLLRYFAAAFLAVPMLIVFTLQPSLCDETVRAGKAH